MSRTSHFHVGIAALVFAGFLAVFGIRYGVSSPSNVSNIVLSPTFWPYVVAGLIGLSGLGLVLSARGAAAGEAEEPRPEGGWMRLMIMAALMVGYVLLTPVLGLVWTSMLAFIGLAFLIRTDHPKSAFLAAILVPLALYLFFAHVAGMAVPQGAFVRLP